VVAGDTVSEVLQFVDYSPSDLLGRMRNVEQALRKKLMTIEETRTLINQFRQGMIGHTYLDRECSDAATARSTRLHLPPHEVRNRACAGR
jgi:arginine decarboxylase